MGEPHKTMLEATEYRRMYQQVEQDKDIRYIIFEYNIDDELIKVYK